MTAKKNETKQTANVSKEQKLTDEINVLFASEKTNNRSKYNYEKIAKNIHLLAKISALNISDSDVKDVKSNIQKFVDSKTKFSEYAKIKKSIRAYMQKQNAIISNSKNNLDTINEAQKRVDFLSALIF